LTGYISPKPSPTGYISSKLGKRLALFGVNPHLRNVWFWSLPSLLSFPSLSHHSHPANSSHPFPLPVTFHASPN